MSHYKHNPFNRRKFVKKHIQVVGCKEKNTIFVVNKKSF